MHLSNVLCAIFLYVVAVWQLPVANVQAVDKRIVFGQVAIHLSSTRYGALRNVGRNHAYFQVVYWLCIVLSKHSIQALIEPSVQTLVKELNSCFKPTVTTTTTTPI